MENIYTLIAKYFNGQCDEVERKEVDDWKMSNVEAFEALKSVWQLSGDAEYVHFDEKAGWEAFENLIETQSTTKNKTIFIRPLYKYLAAASVVLALIAIAIQSPFNNSSDIVAFDDVRQLTDELRGNSLKSANKTAKTYLSDGNLVWLNKNSHMHDFGIENSRYLVEMIEGAAYFDVHQTGNNPDEIKHIVQSQYLDIETHKSVFVVDIQASKSQVYVLEGSLHIIAKDLQQLRLKKGQAAVFENKQLKQMSSYSPNAISWKTGVFAFDKTPIKRVIQLLQGYYDVEIDYEVDASLNYTGAFNQEALSDVLNTIAQQLPLTIEEVDKGQYYIISDSK